MMKLQKKIPFIPKPLHPAYDYPGWNLRWSLGFLKAQMIYRPLFWVKFQLGIGPQVIWGERVCFFSSARIKGPGKVFIGNDTLFDSKPDIYTHNIDAQIHIGNLTFVNGTRIGCTEKISFGEGCILADARIMDTDFHSLKRNRIYNHAPVKVKPVNIGANVWIAANAAILKGVTIGKDSVIGFGSVVNSDVAEGKIVAGNPAKEVGEIP